MSEVQMEYWRRVIRSEPGSEAYERICRIPLEKRHPSMRDLPYVPR